MNSCSQTHIAHIVYSFKTGGLENGIVNLINRLPADKFKHTIICLTDHDPEFAKRLQNPVEILSLNKQPGPDWKLYGKAWTLLRQLKPDVVHTRNIATIEYQIPAFLARVPHRIHGEHGWDVGDLHGSNDRYIRLKRCLRPLIHDFIALSKEARDYLVDKVGVPPQHCHKITNGVDTERFQPELAAAPWPQDFDAQDWQSAIVFGTVGRLAAVKNQQLMITAFDLLRERLPDQCHRLKLIIVGDGEQRSALEKLIDEKQLKDAVWMTGNQDNIPAFMQLFDIFVLPSLAEGISNTLLEAMASGLPVIATDVGGNSELVDQGQTGLLTPLQGADGGMVAMAEAMAAFANDNNKISQYGQQARQHVLDNFSLDAMVNLYQNVYLKQTD